MTTKPFDDDNKLEDCFIITPIGDVNSEVYKKTNGLISAIITPVLKDFNLSPVPAHEVNSTGSIAKNIIKHLFEDRLVIANLTGLNANVMYELAIRHAVKLPVIMMAEYGTKLPFDIYDQRTVFYYDNLEGVEDCKPRLSAMIDSALNTDATIDNPIYDAIKVNTLLKDTNTGDADAYIIGKLEEIQSALNASNTFAFNHSYQIRKHGALMIEQDGTFPTLKDAQQQLKTQLNLDGVININFLDINETKFVMILSDITGDKFESIAMKIPGGKFTSGAGFTFS